jgi:hypothetical protein
MKVSAFTFIKNALIYDFPIIEAIQSVLPLCDAFVVAVGKSEDATLELIKSINDPKIIIIETVWDESQRKGGKVLAMETDKALAAIPADSDWAFYIQGDEVLHESHLNAVMEAMLKYKDDKKVEGILFKYLHFYGSYDYVGNSSKWYRNEIRVIRPGIGIYSYKDAQGFRKGDNEKLKVKAIDSCIYHYGWVKDPKTMQKKKLNSNKFWHEDSWIDKNVAKGEEFNFMGIDSLQLFKGQHPKLMQPRIDKMNWKFDYDISFNKIKFKDRVKSMLNEYLGIDLNYRNYKLLR